MFCEHLIGEDEAEEHNGFTVSLHYDGDCENPRASTDYNLGLFLGRNHRRYDIGDETVPEEVEERGPKFVERWIKIHYRPRVLLRVGMIDHSGLSFYVGGGAHWSDPGGWDSSTCGWMFDTPETLTRAGFGDEFQISDDELREALVGEIEEYNSWSTGDCYGYVIERDGEYVDSCWGYIGYENVKTEALSQLAWYEKNRPSLTEEWWDAYCSFYAAA